MIPKHIGELNGPWSVLFRVQLALASILFPFIVGWCVWVTVHMFGLESDIKVMSANMSNIKEDVDDIKREVRSE